MKSYIASSDVTRVDVSWDHELENVYRMLVRIQTEVRQPDFCTLLLIAASGYDGWRQQLA